ncbi:tetraacyldisaccharide 4'-kinase [Parabacteroides sp. PFB2-10]|uniref:tetraacyldisaccharide 4'-kinase n=1 Tax=Parabacteroides sp. PFB2-10 TaxID=1742405 RepID=UPI002476435D|nr:tetraacyldisaccharide 4'-kinase [Parabacteroides sp. PFB2-10]MDH6311626.1 tetraacyldisaccharide 4'-kinase [Parabacteroides sp. PFB2-10]
MPTDNDIKINYALTPLSFFYGLGVGFRNQLFDWGILRSEQFPIPVICVGNLAVGGTGKTPHIEYIIRLLQQKNYRVAVLSRGYKRKTSGFLLADSSSTSEEIGDEPYQIMQKFPDLLLAVDADRREGVRKLLALEENRRPQVVLLDDGFQHRYIKPSFSIILTDYNRLYYHDKLLPAGLLREKIRATRRTDVVVVTKCPKDMKPIDYRIIEDHTQLLAHQKVFFTRMVYNDLQPVFEKAKPRMLRDIRRDDEVLAISGIANPTLFEQEIQKYSQRVIAQHFPDHHDFTKSDFKKLNTLFENMSSKEKLIIVTEKDAARMRHNMYLPEEWKQSLYSLPISVLFTGRRETLFDQILLKHIETVLKNGLPD